MDARIAAQVSAVGHSMPPRGTDQAGAAKRAASSDATPPVAPEVFDANGDGTIESWSYAHGGDSFTTFKPPPSGAAGANVRPIKHAPPVPPAPAAHSAGSHTHASTTAAIHHAHAAYQRDGGATTPDARAAAPATAARAPDPDGASTTESTAAPVTQPADAPALPSSGS